MPAHASCDPAHLASLWAFVRCGVAPPPWGSVPRPWKVHEAPSRGELSEVMHVKHSADPHRRVCGCACGCDGRWTLDGAAERARGRRRGPHAPVPSRSTETPGTDSRPPAVQEDSPAQQGPWCGPVSQHDDREPLAGNMTHPTGQTAHQTRPGDRTTSRPKRLPLTSWLEDALAVAAVPTQMADTRPRRSPEHSSHRGIRHSQRRLPPRPAQGAQGRKKQQNGNRKGQSTAEATDKTRVNGRAHSAHCQKAPDRVGKCAPRQTAHHV